VAAPRFEEVPVVWVQHSDDGLEQGSDQWQIVPELSPAEHEPVVQKHFGDSFEGTDLESVLAGQRVGRVVVTGAQSDACIRSTLHGALVRGYDVTLVGDAHTTEDLTAYGAPSPELVIAHTNLYWSWSDAVGRRGDVVTTDEIDFSEQPG
jgi:nicotinamidase-related amidase